MRRDPELYRQTARRNYIERLSWYTRTLSEIAPSAQKVEVKVIIEFRSGVLDHPVVKQYEEVFPSDKVVRLVYQCPNPDCTSGYFDVTSDVISLIQPKKNGSWEKYCSRKEVVKYCGNGSFGDTTLLYEVIIYYSPLALNAA